MLKKQDDSVGAQPEFASKQMPDSTLETEDEALIKAYREHLAEKGKSAVDPQKVLAHSLQGFLGRRGPTQKCKGECQNEVI